MIAPIKIKYSEPCIQEAIRAYWWRHLGWSFLITLVPLAAFLGYRIESGDRTWVVGVLGFIVILNLAIMIGSYFVRISESLSQVRAMKAPEATLELEEEQFRITSDNWASETKWSSIGDIWHSDKVWLLVLSPPAFVTLPVAELSQEEKSFIISKVQATDQINNYIKKQESIIYRTHQAWKIHFGIVGGVIVSLLIIVGLIGSWFIDSLSFQWFEICLITAIIIGLNVIVVLSTIRCPVCRSRWISKEVINQLNWTKRLLAMKKCPTCGASGDDFTIK